jgi:Protein-glutamine gamma-glutamyltransferase
VKKLFLSLALVSAVSISTGPLAGNPTTNVASNGKTTPFPNSPEGRLIIGNVPLYETPGNYHRYIKHLTVSPARHSSPAFQSANVRAIRALEDPLRRQIFDAMNRNRADRFRFATMRQAQENFTMRLAAIGFMFAMVQKGRNGGIDFDYSGPIVPQAADRGRWSHTTRFTHVSHRGTSATEAIDGIVSHRYRGECLGAMQINVLHAARLALGAACFDRLHPNGLDIGPKAKSVGVHIRSAASVNVRDMVPGDWVYMKNKDDYNTDLRPGVAPGYWQGENALCLGKFEWGANRTPQYSGKATPRFSGMGAYGKSEAELRAAMKKSYLNEMRSPRTLHAHTVTDADIRWFKVDRLVTGN